MPRAPTFDVEAARQRALEVFWLRGYANASMRDLLEAMDLGEGSFYNTFSSKHALFLTTIDLYSEAVEQQLSAELAQGGSPRAALRRLLHKVLNLTAGRGCFFGNCAGEVAVHDEQAALRVRAGLTRLQRIFQRALRDSDELAAETAIKDNAEFLVAHVQGLAVLGKAGVPARRLSALAEQALDAIGI